MAPLLYPLTSSHDTVQGGHSSETYKFPDFSLTFYQWETINVYIHFSFFLQAIDIFLFIFSLFLLFAERGKESIHNKNHWPQLLHGSGIECQIDCFACSAAYFSSFLRENAFQSLEENLWTINQKTEFPDFSLTLTISKIFPDFSLTMATLLLQHNKFLPFPK